MPLSRLQTVEAAAADTALDMSGAVLRHMSEWIRSLSEYLEKKSRFAPQTELARWINSKEGGVCAFNTRGDCLPAVESELIARNIPYVTLDVNGKNCIMIRDIDKARVTQINSNVLVAMGNYYQEVDKKSMENAIATTTGFKDKNIVEMSNLTKYEAVTLKNKCNQIAKGFMVGIEENGGTKENPRYSLAIHAPKLLLANPDKQDFCKSFLEMTFSLYGPNALVKCQQIDDDETFDKDLAAINKEFNLGRRDETLYIAGVQNTDRYIELTPSGFSFKEKVLQFDHEEGAPKYVDKTLFSADRSSPDFNLELLKATDQIQDKIVLSGEDFYEHMKTDEQNFVSGRTEKNVAQEMQSVKESSFINQMDSYINERLLRANYFEKPHTYESMFKMYKNEVLKIVGGLQSDSVPSGHSEKKFNEFKENVKRTGIDLDDYYLSISHIESASIDVHKAKEKAIPVKSSAITR